MRALVTGATGLQGGAVARALLARGHSVRAVTRRPEQPAAQALGRAGAEVIAGDLADGRRVDALVDGCDWVFGLTNYWEHQEREVDHAKNIVEACASRKKATHLVLSTLASAAVASHGEIRVPHLETKHAMESYARERSVRATFVHVAYYYENFLTWFAPRRGSGGRLAFGFPQGTAPLAAVGVEDVGPVVASIFEEGDRARGETIGIVGDERPCAEYAATLGRVIGEPVDYAHVPRETFAALGFPGASDLAAMFDFTRRFVSTRRGDLQDTLRRHPGAASFDVWANAHAAALQKLA